MQDVLAIEQLSALYKAMTPHVNDTGYSMCMYMYMCNYVHVCVMYMYIHVNLRWIAMFLVLVVIVEQILPDVVIWVVQFVLSPCAVLSWDDVTSF